MKPKLLASLIDHIDDWLDKNADDHILTINIGELMAQSAAAVFDAIQEASNEAEPVEEEAG